MVSGIAGRTAVAMPNNVGPPDSVTRDGVAQNGRVDGTLQARPSRLGDYGVSSRYGSDSQTLQPATTAQGMSGPSNVWSGNIWSKSAIGTGFGSTTRDSSRLRGIPQGTPASDRRVSNADCTDNGAFLDLGDGVIEGKTGSGSLLASSEQDTWTRQQPAWASDNSYVAAKTKESGMSSVRHRNGQQIPPAQSFSDHIHAGANVFSAPKLSKSMNKYALDPMSGNFSSVKYENGAAGFGSSGRFGDSDSHRATEANMGPWGDAASIQSPTEDRRSTSGYFGRSAAPSRSGSLPPSRHGADSSQITPTSNAYQGLSSARGHPAGLSAQSNDRPFQDRSDSIHSDAASMFSRLSIDGYSEAVPMLQRPSISTGGSAGQLIHSSSDYSRIRQSISDASHSLPGHADCSNGSFTPDGFPSAQYSDQMVALRGLQFGSRGAMTPADYRQSPYYSTGGTPPGVAGMYEQMYPWRKSSEPSARQSANVNPVLLQQRLQGLEEQQRFISPQYQPMMAAQFRGQYNPYQYAMPNGQPMSGLNPGIQLPAMPTMMPAIEAPKAPRDHDSGMGVRSVLLDEFRSNGKTSRRYELKVDLPPLLV